MKRQVSTYRRAVQQLSDRTSGRFLAAIIALSTMLKIAAAWVLEQPLESDSLSYFTMAKGLTERGELLDIHGQHAFYSAGYPLVLFPFFALLGSTVSAALVANLLLGVISTWLVYKLAVTLSENRGAGLVAAAVYALWFPGIWNATMLAKENLTIPLLLGLALSALKIARDDRPTATALAAGVLWGASLVTGGSALLLCAGMAVALVLLWLKRGRFGPALVGGLSFLAGALLILTPWLIVTNQMVGRPVLTTNAAFNLYLGNNPAATGRFVSISDTPLGKDWNETRLRLGEVANADRLQAEALRWIAAHPGTAAELAARKLIYFWQPNVPDSADFAASKAVGAIRLFEVAQYGAILLFSLLAFGSRLISRDDKWIIAAMLAGFWLIHAAAYIIPRYRDPAIPLLIAMAAVPVAAWLEHFAARKTLRHAT